VPSSSREREIPDYRYLVMYPDPNTGPAIRTDWFKEKDGQLALLMAQKHGVELRVVRLFGDVKSEALFSGKKFEDLGKIRQERSAYYGDALQNHRTIGKMWTGALEQFYSRTHPGFKLPFDIPGELVALFQLLVKVNRQCFRRKQDNIDDGKNYFDIANECGEKERPECEF